MRRTLFWIALVGLIVLHHDWWFWNDGRLVWGFVPVGLAYHAFISLAAAALWAWTVYRGWPELFEQGDEPS